MEHGEYWFRANINYNRNEERISDGNRPDATELIEDAEFLISDNMPEANRDRISYSVMPKKSAIIFAGSYSVIDKFWDELGDIPELTTSEIHQL